MTARIQRLIFFIGFLISLGASTAFAQSIQFDSTYYAIAPQSYFNIIPQLIGFPQGVPVNCTGYGLPAFVHVDPNTCAVYGNSPYYPSPGSIITFQVSSPLAMMTTLNFEIVSPTVSFPQTNYQLAAGQPTTIAPQLIDIPAGTNLGCGFGGNLPPGINFDFSSCTLSGTIPLGVLPAGDNYFNVTIYSTYLTSPVYLTLDATDSYLMQYSASNYQITAGQPVNIVPVTSGYAPGQSLNCGYSGDLPQGLSFDFNSCAITGTIPLGVLPLGGTQSVLTIFAGFIPTPVTLTLNATDAYSISYAQSSYQVPAGQFTYIAPSIGGFANGQSLNCGYSGQLPQGLSFDFNGCAILGTIPLGVLPLGGSQATITISSPFLDAPVTLTLVATDSYVIQYSASTFTINAGQAVSIVPTTGGFAAGESLACGYSGTLPQGLTFDFPTCSITGTIPLGVLPVQGAQAVITITSPYLQVPTTLTFNERDAYSITYSAPSYNLKVGRSVTIAPTISGFAANQNLSCSVTGEATPGLKFNSSTCTFTGAPSRVWSATVKVQSPYLLNPIKLVFNVGR